MDNNERFTDLEWRALVRISYQGTPVSLEFLSTRCLLHGRETKVNLLNAIGILVARGFVLPDEQDGHATWHVTTAGMEVIQRLSPLRQSIEERERIEVPTLQPREIQTPSLATVCIDEDDLDAWWGEQDVDLKAEIFLLWSLGSTQELHDCPEHRIRLAGTVGASAAGPVRQGDGDGTADLGAGTMADEIRRTVQG
jgi:hypothetical protein